MTITIQITRADDNAQHAMAYGGNMGDAMRNAYKALRHAGTPCTRYYLRDCLGGLRAEVKTGATRKESLTIKKTP